MKAIHSPYSDSAFNDYLLKYIKDRLTKRSFLFICEYTFEGKEYTGKDIINSIKRHDRKIYFSNQKLVNYAVYDLSQRFWYEELSLINNIIHKLYLEFRGTYGQSSIK